MDAETLERWRDGLFRGTEDGAATINDVRDVAKLLAWTVLR